MITAPLLFVLDLFMVSPEAPLAQETVWRGMTISCQGYGRIWGTDVFAAELDRLKTLGVNSISIHPYARIGGDGAVSWRWSMDEPPEYLTRPIREARQRGLTIMIKPHLAYWGGPFSWRGEIGFSEPEQRRRFFDQYKRWIVLLARVTRDADLFVLATELKANVFSDSQWRELVAAVRQETSAQLTLAPNWDDFENVSFWGDLDLIGVQGYFPISQKDDPSDDDLRQGWALVIERLKKVQTAHRKPVVFTEFGYNRSMKAAAEPWLYQQDTAEEAEIFQARCLEVGLNILARERAWLRGAFLWKWFAGPTRRENFILDTPRLREVIVRNWRTDPNPSSKPGMD